MLEIIALELGDEAQSWCRVGFTVEADAIHVGTVVMQLCGTGGRGGGGVAARGVVGWKVRGIAADAALDGLPTVVVDSPLGVAATHANGATIIDHVVIATPDVDRTVATFVAAGCEPRRERVGGTPATPIRQVFVRAGEVILEIVGPPVAPDNPELRSRPATFWGLAFTTDNLDACAALLGDAMSAPKDAVQPGRRIATLNHRRIGVTVPTVFMS